MNPRMDKTTRGLSLNRRLFNTIEGHMYNGCQRDIEHTTGDQRSTICAGGAILCLVVAERSHGCFSLHSQSLSRDASPPVPIAVQ